MERSQTQARLVDPGAFGGQGVSAVLRRGEIERVVGEGMFPAQLLLEVSRVADGGEPEPGEVIVSWGEEELKQLLRSAETGSDEVTLWFDRVQLEHALDADVEAHGLRERTAMLAIAVAAAGATAGGAFAHPEITGSAGSGVTPAAASHSFVSDVASSDAVSRYEANLAASQPVSDVASSDAVSRYEANLAASQPVSDVASSDAVARYEANAAVSEGDAVSRYETNVTTGTGGDVLSRYQANVTTDATPAATVSGASAGWSLTAGEDAAIAAGVLLLITGAGFLTVRTRRQEIRPA